MPIRVRNRSRYNEHFRPFRSMKADIGPYPPPQKLEQFDAQALEEFDKEFEEFVAEQKKLKKKRKKHANDQSDQQVEADLKL